MLTRKEWANSRAHTHTVWQLEKNGGWKRTQHRTFKPERGLRKTESHFYMCTMGCHVTNYFIRWRISSHAPPVFQLLAQNLCRVTSTHWQTAPAPFTENNIGMFFHLNYLPHLLSWWPALLVKPGHLLINCLTACLHSSWKNQSKMKNCSWKCHFVMFTLRRVALCEHKRCRCASLKN